MPQCIRLLFLSTIAGVLPDTQERHRIHRKQPQFLSLQPMYGDPAKAKYRVQARSADLS